jgi:hypothetical protein
MRIISKDKLFFNYLYDKKTTNNDQEKRIPLLKTDENKALDHDENRELRSREEKRYKDSVINNLKKISFKVPCFDQPIKIESNKKLIKLPTLRQKYEDQLNSTQRSEMLKTSIYTNLLPPKERSISSFNFTNYKNKSIEIANPILRKNLETINYFGPHYSHCPPCRERNIVFYQSMTHIDSMRLIDYLKQVRVKK